MIKIEKDKLGEVLQTEVSNLSVNTISGKFNIDSRTVESGQIFVPRKGSTVDAHTFIPSVFEKGAELSFCEKKYFDENKNVLDKYLDKLIFVNDVKQSYFSLMRWWRQQFPNVICIGIGGSVGKTTTKELMRRICEEDGITLYTKGNLNTPWGMCDVVNELEENTKYMVCEMGTDTFGEITDETFIAQPEIGVCLSVTATHAEYLGGKIDGVAKAESELVQYFSDHGTIVLNKDDEYVYKMRELIKSAKIITFGKNDADTIFSNYIFDISGLSVDLNILKNIKVPTWGEGNVYNIMAVVTIAKELGINDDKILKGLQNFTPEKNRLNFFKLSNEINVMNDSYNANPQSMKQSFEVFQKLSGDHKKVMVLGDMRELGEHAQIEHEKFGEMIKNAKPDQLFYFGDFTETIKRYVENNIAEYYFFPRLDTKDAYKINDENEVEKAYKFVNEKITPDSWILFKASLGTGVWKVAEFLKKNNLKSE